jgi:hypothetical protein
MYEDANVEVYLAPHYTKKLVRGRPASMVETRNRPRPLRRRRRLGCTCFRFGTEGSKPRLRCCVLDTCEPPSKYRKTHSDALIAASKAEMVISSVCGSAKHSVPSSLRHIESARLGDS